MVDFSFPQRVANYYWRSERPLLTTSESALDFIETQIPDEATVVFTDGSYLEVEFNDKIYSVSVKGDGDFYNNVATIKRL